MMDPQDKVLLAAKGISEEKIAVQMECFKKGFPYMKLQAAASTEKGILSLDKNETDSYLEIWNNYTLSGKKIIKFVPASGAASRMFKSLFGFLSADYDVPSKEDEKKFFENIKNFAFYDDLNEVCVENEGENIDKLLAGGAYKTVIDNLLNDKGLGYGNLPKGLLKFHKYIEGARTPLEEHLVEGALYAADEEKQVHVHFTVSPAHLELFKKKVVSVVPSLEKKYGVKYVISFSDQKASTDTIAVNLDNTPFRDEKGSLMFRPGGHGALIENLNDLDGDVAFIKNIDNVVPDSIKGDTIRFKKALAGVLVTLQAKAFEYLNLLDTGKYSIEQLREIIQFVQKQLCVKNVSLKQMEDADMVLYLKNKLNRPMRVCGMVRNVGEAGGGPFLAYNADGTVSLQILESSQIDMDDPEMKAMFMQGTHFNPVDLVCGLCDYKGKKFDLTKYVDPSTGFISQKSKNGKDLRALELPGLWNGAMSDWNTIFVEVPLETFNPVKSVTDLLRPQHQS